MSNTGTTVAKIMAAAVKSASETPRQTPKMGALYDFYDNIPLPKGAR